MAKNPLANLLALMILIMPAGGLTYITIANAHTGATTQIAPSSTPTPKPSPTPTPVSVRTATATSAVFIRSGKGTNSSILTGLDAGSVVTLGNDSDENWQEVTYNNFHGYIFKPYLKY